MTLIRYFNMLSRIIGFKSVIICKTEIIQRQYYRIAMGLKPVAMKKTI